MGRGRSFHLFILRLHNFVQPLPTMQLMPRFARLPSSHRGCGAMWSVGTCLGHI